MIWRHADQGDAAGVQSAQHFQSRLVGRPEARQIEAQRPRQPRQDPLELGDPFRAQPSRNHYDRASAVLARGNL